MSDADETVWVVFNGEIYNFKELRAELRAARPSLPDATRTPRSSSTATRSGGPEVLDRLNGMFGLAIWDAERARLVVARDAMGIKLVYYRADGRAVDVRIGDSRGARSGSETTPDVDPLALNLFLRFRYTPSPLTIFSGIRKLAPGTHAGRRERRVPRGALVQLHAGPVLQRRRTRTRRPASCCDLYKGAVERHLLSDVPVGHSAQRRPRLRAAARADERARRLVAGVHRRVRLESSRTTNWPTRRRPRELLGARHIPVRLDRQEFERSLPKIVGCLEEPIASSSIVPMYFVCQRAREDVKVALIGQGPDELFCGYKRHLGRPLRAVVAQPAAGRCGRLIGVGRQPAATQRTAEARRVLARHRGPPAAGTSTSSRSRPRRPSAACSATGLLPRRSQQTPRWATGARCCRRWRTSTTWAGSSSWRSARRCPTSC